MIYGQGQAYQAEVPTAGVAEAPAPGTITQEIDAIQCELSALHHVLDMAGGKFQFPPQPEAVEKNREVVTKSGLASKLQEVRLSICLALKHAQRIAEAL